MPADNIGGDGAAWLRNGAENIGTEYQYYRFHMERDLRRLFKSQPDIRKALKKTIKAADLEAFNMIIDAVITDADKDREEALKAYKSLMNGVWDGITD